MDLNHKQIFIYFHSDEVRIIQKDAAVLGFPFLALVSFFFASSSPYEQLRIEMGCGVVAVTCVCTR